MNPSGPEPIPCRQMRFPLAIVAVSLCAILGGCSLVESPPPSPSSDAGPDGSSPESVAPDPTEIAFGQVVGAWRPAPIHLGDPQIAVVSDACAAAAREQLGEYEANLPTALVDARGENVATAILADDERAMECRVRIDSAGGVTVDRVDRLTPSATVPVADAGVDVASLVQVPDRAGDRTLLIGRVGPKAFQVKLGFDDDTEVFASNADGWYAAWWPGHARASAIVAVDNKSLVIGTADAPKGEVVGEMGRASWWLDPKAQPPTADATSIRGFVEEVACASGKSPEGRIQGPLFDLTETDMTVTFGVRQLTGGQDCQGSAPFPVRFDLPEPLAGRTLLDGNEVPPRDASKPPAG
jgi:hypothetical protein